MSLQSGTSGSDANASGCITTQPETNIEEEGSERTIDKDNNDNADRKSVSSNHASLGSYLTDNERQESWTFNNDCVTFGKCM